VSLLLVNPPGLRANRGGSFFEDQKRNLASDQYYSMPMEHLGIMSIKAFGASRGLEIESVNGMVSSHASVDETWHAMQDAVQRSGPPALVGFSNIDTFFEVLELARRSKAAWDGVRIVFGNTFASLNYEHLLSAYDCFDYVIVGDGELSFASLADAVVNNTSVDEVPSLVWRNASGALQSSPRSSVDLDALPWPARDELPAVLEAGFAAAVYATRGCPYRCTFCGTGAMSDLLGRDGYRLRSVESVVDEMEFLVADFGVEFISISVDLFISKHPRMQQRAADFADEILRRGLDVSFMFDARVDSIEDLALFAHLYRAGLRRVFIGIETGSYEQLVLYRKHSMSPGEDAAVKIDALHDLGIEVVPGTIMFHPTVQPNELRETARLLRALRYQTPRKFMDRVTAYAGTPLWHEYNAKGYLTSAWPVGTWDFPDPEARRVFDAVVAHITAHPSISFEEAYEFFLATVDDWEARIASVPDGSVPVGRVEH
jgi:radical SAM superfamily enzyme YgiQ (UPF0313 family)